MKTYTVACTLAALAGCAALPPPPLHAAWYLQYTPGAAQKTENEAGKPVVEDGNNPDRKSGYRLYVALINRSGRDIPVAEVIVNPRAGAPDSAWRWIPGEHGLSDELTFPIGRLVTLPFDQFAMKAGASGESVDRNCVLPVEIAVILATDPADPRPWHERWYGRAQGDSSGMIRAEIAGRMPSSLPDDWAQRCQP